MLFLYFKDIWSKSSLYLVDYNINLELKVGENKYEEMWVWI